MHLWNCRDISKIRFVLENNSLDIQDREHSLSANGMRRERDFPERKWKRRENTHEVAEERPPKDEEPLPPSPLWHHPRPPPPQALVEENVGPCLRGIRACPLLGLVPFRPHPWRMLSSSRNGRIPTYSMPLSSVHGFSNRLPVTTIFLKKSPVLRRARVSARRFSASGMA